MRKRQAICPFVDISAREIQNEDEESDLSDLSDISELDNDLDATGPPPIPTFHEEMEDLDAIVTDLRRRASTSGYTRVSNQVPLGRYGRLEPLSLLEQQALMPRAEDMPLFSIQVKRGKELEVLLNLTRKALAFHLPDVGAIVQVAKCPGRIYIESRSPNTIRRLCGGMLHVYLKSMFHVPIAERVAILQHHSPKSPFKRGDFVQIRNGLYQDDFGEVFDISENGGILTLKVMSREHLPFDGDVGDMEAEPSFPAEGDNDPQPSRKRKRKNGSRARRAPYLLDEPTVSAVLQEYKDHPVEGEVPFKNLGSEGYLHLDKRYSLDGYLFLHIRSDRVVKRTAVNRNANWVTDLPMRESVLEKAPSNSGSDLVPESMEASLPRLLKPGDSVRLRTGSLAGTIGRVVEVTTSTSLAVVDIQDLHPEFQRSTMLEMKLDDLDKFFSVGDHVEVKLGVWKGRTGMIGAIEGGTATVADPASLFQCTVSMACIDTFRPPLLLSSPRKPVQLKRGDTVKVLIGKHASKIGTISVVEQFVVRLIEQDTEKEIRVWDDNVEVLFRESEDTIDAGKEAIEEIGSKCETDHQKDGFAGQLVYVWRGRFKGKLGYVLRLSGSLARLSVDSAIRGESILDIQTSSLVAKCRCVLDPKVSLPWNESDAENILLLFNREMVFRLDSPPRGSIEVNSTPVTEEMREFHDPQGKGMWIYNRKIAEIRKTFDLIVKIDCPGQARSFGLRTGRILACDEPLSNPIPIEISTDVMVNFLDAQIWRDELLPVSTLKRTPHLKAKGQHVVIKGNRMGTMVTHIKSDGEMARVAPVGVPRRSAFYIEREKLCVVELTEKKRKATNQEVNAHVETREPEKGEKEAVNASIAVSEGQS